MPLSYKYPSIYNYAILHFLYTYIHTHIGKGGGLTLVSLDVLQDRQISFPNFCDMISSFRDVNKCSLSDNDEILHISKYKNNVMLNNDINHLSLENLFQYLFSAFI